MVESKADEWYCSCHRNSVDPNHQVFLQRQSCFETHIELPKCINCSSLYYPLFSCLLACCLGAASAAKDSVPENYYQIVADRLRDGLKNQVRGNARCRKCHSEFHGLLVSNGIHVYTFINVYKYCIYILYIICIL